MVTLRETAYETFDDASWRARPSEPLARPPHDHSTGPSARPAPRAGSRLVRLAIDAGILGGILLSPIVSVLGWISLVLPAPAPLHHAAASLLVCALIWLTLAVALAHTCRVHSAHPNESASPRWTRK